MKKHFIPVVFFEIVIIEIDSKDKNKFLLQNKKDTQEVEGTVKSTSGCKSSSGNFCLGLLYFVLITQSSLFHDIFSVLLIPIRLLILNLKHLSVNNIKTYLIAIHVDTHGLALNSMYQRKLEQISDNNFHMRKFNYISLSCRLDKIMMNFFKLLGKPFYSAAFHSQRLSEPFFR